MEDYHLHTYLCKHAYGEMEAYVQAAVDQGISEICFTDHIPFPDGYDLEHRMAPEEMDYYTEQIGLLRMKYRHVNILTGIEADYSAAFEEYFQDFFSTRYFDMVLMAIHFVDSWTNGDWVFNYEFSEENIQQKYRDYFEAMIKGIETGLFDVVAHLDLIKRPGFPVLKTNKNDVLRVLDAVKKQGMSIELNTSGYRRAVNEPYPSLDILQLAVEKNIPIILSSDAHKPEQVGYAFDHIVNLLFQYPGLKVARYSNRTCQAKLFGPDEEAAI